MGFDIHNIPNVELVPREYFCSVYKHLVHPNEALQAMCGHLFCKPCLASVARTTMACPYDGYLVTEANAKPLVESNRVLAETISQTMVYCSYHSSGCTWMGSISESSFHSSECAFSNSLVACSWCDVVIPHLQWQEHAPFCRQMVQADLDAYNQASAAMATSQVSAQGHGVAPATLTQEQQWYQQQYQQYYQNSGGDYMHQHPLHVPNFAPQQQVFYVQPAYYSVAQTHSQMQPQPQLQSQRFAVPQPHYAFSSPPYFEARTASLPQTYFSVPPYPQHPSQTLPASPSLQNLQAQAHFRTTPLSQTHYSQDAQVPQYQLFHGQIRSQFEMQNLMNPQANTVQTSLPQNTTGQRQSTQPQAYWTGQRSHPQPDQNDHVGAPPNNTQDGNQYPRMEDYLTQQVWNFQLPQSNPDGSEASLTSESTYGVIGVNHAVARDESVHRSSTVVEDNERTRGALGKQVMEEDVGTRGRLGKQVMEEDVGTRSGRLGKQVMEEDVGTRGRLGRQVMEEDVGNFQKNLLESLIEYESSMNGTPLVNPALLSEDEIQRLCILRQRHLLTAHLHREDVERSRASSSKSSLRPHENHEPGFELRRALGISQPSIDLGEGQFRRGPRSLMSEHFGMPSHGYGPLDHGLGGSRVETTDTEGRRLGLLRSIKIEEEELDDGMIGPLDSIGLRLGDVGSRRSSSLQGRPGDGGSSSGGLGYFPNSGTRETTPSESSGSHSQRNEQDVASMNVRAPGGSSPFGKSNQK